MAALLLYLTCILLVLSPRTNLAFGDYLDRKT
jgi:hypothetical protein